jgi:hypothetical protein
MGPTPFVMIGALLILCMCALYAVHRDKGSSQLSKTVVLAAYVMTVLALPKLPANGATSASPTTIDAVIEQTAHTDLSRCSDAAFRIDLLSALRALPDDTLEAQRQQIIDWIWTVTLGRIAQQTSAADIFSGTVAELLLRDDQLELVLDMPVGSARIMSVESGYVIALVEAADEISMKATLVEAIDRETLKLGHTPEHALVYRYELQGDVARAEVCLLGRLDRSDLESDAFGYRRASIDSRNDLERFIAEDVDLLSVQYTRTGIDVTGRKRTYGVRARVTATQIAALNGFGYKESAGISIDPSADRTKAKEDIDEWLAALRDPEKKQGVLARWNGSIAISTVLESRLAGDSELAEVEARLREVRERLDWIKSENIVDLLTRQSGGSLGEEVATSILMDVWRRNSRQCVRYLGPLKSGTETAMNFIYTDLLMKRRKLLWSDSALKGEIPDLDSSTPWRRSTDLCERKQLSSTRISFAAAQHSYAIDRSGSSAPKEDRALDEASEDDDAAERSERVLFAPTVAHLSVTSWSFGSSDPSPAPDDASFRFVHWWNQHYSQIAEQEPQYEILNQLMKWSIVTQKAPLGVMRKILKEAEPRGEPARSQWLVRSLGEMISRGDNKFDQWISETYGLTWRGPVNLDSMMQDGRECFPLFSSEPFNPCVNGGPLMGGISGGCPWEPPSSVSSSVRGLWGKVLGLVTDGNRIAFTEVRRHDGKLMNGEIISDAVKVLFRANIETLSSRSGIIRRWRPGVVPRTFEKIVEVTKGRLLGRQSTNGLLNMELKAYDLLEAEVHMEAKLMTVADAQSTAGKLIQRVAHDGGSLADAAAHEIAAEREVLSVASDKIVVRVQSEEGGKVYALIELARGPRGPPLNIVSAPAGQAYRAGSALASREPAVRVTILLGEETERLAEQQGAKLLRPVERALAQMKEDLARGSLKEGISMLETHVEEQLIRTNRSIPDLRALRDLVVEAGVRAAREGDRNASAVASRLTTKLSIAERMGLMEGVAEAQARSAGVNRLPVFIPVSYPGQSPLPPAVHPVGKALEAGERFVSRIVYEASSTLLPQEVRVGETALRLGSQGGAAPQSAGVVGSAFRIIGRFARPVVIVTKCHDRPESAADEDVPPCHEPPPAGD